MSRELTVFVVDDDQAMRSSLQWLIESIGMQVETFDSAQAFLDAYYPGAPAACCWTCACPA
jgi:two-component system response regulator FixJ